MTVINFNTSDYPPFSRERYQHQITSIEAEESFIDELDRFGLDVGGYLETEKIVRVSHRDKPRKKTGWYLYFGVDPSSGIAGGIYGDWRYSDDYHYWCSKSKIEVTPDKWAQYQRSVEDAKAKAEAEKLRLQNEAAKRCQSELQTLPELTQHPYLDRKQVQAYGLYGASDDALIVPMCNAVGELRNLQRIYPNGDKYFTESAQVLGCYHIIGNDLADIVYVCEGYATGATIYEITGKTVIVAFNTANLKPVALALCRVYPGIRIIFAADNDRFTEGNPGVTKANEAATSIGNAVVKVPNFKGNTGTDFNDLMLLEGGETVKQQLCNQLSPYFTTIFDASTTHIDDFEPRSWIYDRLLLAGYISVEVAPGGSGKSVLSLVIAISVALGRPLLEGHKVHCACNVLVVNNEDDKSELQRRLLAICQYYGVDVAELEGKLFIGSGYETPLVIAREVDNYVMPTPACNELITFAQDKNIGLIIADPFASIHHVPENDNNAQTELMAVCRTLCAKTGVALLLVAHTKKMGGHSETHAGDVEALRGATAVRDSARVAFTLARMSKQTAEENNIDPKIAASLIRIDDAKRNFSNYNSEAEWLHLESVQLPNGDRIGVPATIELDSIATENNNGFQAMTGCRFAELIEEFAGDDVLQRGHFLFSDIKERLVQATGFSQRSIERHVTLLSQDPKNPSRIRPNGIIYVNYYTKKSTGRNGQWMIFREEMN